MGEDPLITHQIVIPGWTAGGVPALWVSENPLSTRIFLNIFKLFGKNLKQITFYFKPTYFKMPKSQ